MLENSLDLNQSPYIRDIEKGLLKNACFLLKKITINVSKKQKPFLRVLLSDKTGHLPGVFFGHEKELRDITTAVQEGDVVNVSGVLEEYQSNLQFKIFKIEKSKTDQKDLNRFWKRTPFDRKELYKKLKELLLKIKEPTLKELCFLFLKDRSFMKLFLDAPASRFVHHSYLGGLLEHTLHVMQLSEAYSHVFEIADRDLLLAGSFLHDIGKVDEYNFLFEINRSSLGKLKGHTLLGYERLQEKMRHISLDPEIKLKLEHILLSHQGKRIWGAVEEPRFLEAYLVHAADSTDSSQFIYANAKRNSNSDSRWSEMILYLNRDVYIK